MKMNSLIRMELETCKLFIGGISWDTNEIRLKEYFQNFGEVNEAVIMKDRATGRARGFGFVVFADPAVAERVVQEKHFIDGRTVEAKKAVPRDDQNILNRNNGGIHAFPGPARTKKIFVGGLASTVTENDFKEYFQQFGTIIDVVVMYDHNTQRPRGFGFITYVSEEAVDQVLHKTFHELNGKMVEVKRAVPKELSPGPSRGQSVGYNYSPNRLSNLLNEHTMGYKQCLGEGYGARMDNRFSPASGVRNGLPPVGPGYMTGLNFEAGSNPGYGFGANFNSNIGPGRGWNPFYGGNSSTLGSPVRFGGGAVANSCILSSPVRNLWGDGSLSFSSDSSISSALTTCLSGNSGVGSFDNIEAIWDASKSSGPDGSIGASFISGNPGFGSNNAILGRGRNNNTNNITQTPFYSVSSSGYNGTYADPREGIPASVDPNRLLLPSELDEAFLFGYGFGNATSDVMTKSASGYGVISRQTNRGIAA